VVLAPPLDVALQRDRDRGTKQVGHLFRHMDAELRRELDGVGFWLDTADLDVSATVDAILDGGLEAGRLR
jgi:hypothetical protein